MLKTGANGEIVRLADVARIELGASDYTIRGQLDNDTTAIARRIPGTRRQLADHARCSDREDGRAGQALPARHELPCGLRLDGLRARIDRRRRAYAAEAIILVVLVVILFLQTWRASIIPLIAVPVSVVGTFAVLYALGFTINTLTLFGLVLAIGIVVDDAIVVVENVERNIAEGLTPLAAAHQAMKEVSGPIVAIALVLCAVFVPMAFLDRRIRHVLQAVRGDDRDLDRDLGDQFADPVARARRKTAARARCPERSTRARHRARVRLAVPPVQPLLPVKLRQISGFGVAHPQAPRRRVRGLRRAAPGHGLHVRFGAARLYPDPGQALSDGMVKLPEGASLERTAQVLRKVKDITNEAEGVAHVVAFAGSQPAAVQQHAELRHRVPRS